MHGLQLFILTSLEITAFLILWGTFSVKLNCRNILKLAALAIIIPLITVITDHFRIEYSGVLNYLIAFIVCIYYSNSRLNSLSLTI